MGSGWTKPMSESFPQLSKNNIPVSVTEGDGGENSVETTHEDNDK